LIKINKHCPVQYTDVLFCIKIAEFKASLEVVFTHLNFLHILTIVEFTAVSQAAQSVYCLAMGWTTWQSRFDPRQRQKDFSSSLCAQISSGAHPASCTLDSGGPFLGAKAWPRHGAEHSPPSSTEVENEWELYLLSPPSAFMAQL
jgi:hypothetical protein